MVETAAVAMEMETEAAVKAVVGWEREARVEEGQKAFRITTIMLSPTPCIKLPLYPNTPIY